MDRTKSDLSYEKRELNKMSLDSYVLDKHNVLDNPIDKIIDNLGQRLKKNWKEHDEWRKMEQENPEKYNNLDEIAQQTGHSLEQQLYDYYIENVYIEEEITALLEVKIIYAFKHFEINLKKLIKAAYDDKNFDKNYKWESIRQYLFLKNIEIKNVDNYTEVNQLREINNAIKHSENYFENNDLKNKIPEFKNKEPSIRDLYKFYNRIKKSPNVFLQSLCSKIYEDLYDFTEDKIEKIAESIAIRMDYKDAKILIEKLKENY